MTEETAGWVVAVRLTPPSLADNTADADRLKNALKIKLGTEDIAIDLSLARRLPQLLRNCDYQLRCVCFKSAGRWEIVELLDPEEDTRAAGIAIDLGTTRVVLRLLDLTTGDILAEDAIDNPQIAIGPDILERIHYAGKEGGLPELKDLIIGGINGRIASLCASAGIDIERVYLLAVAGNTSMTHLFMGLDPRWIIREPYIPVINTPGTVMARDLGISGNPSARVFIFPNVGSYFGGDLISGAVYAELDQSKKVTMLVDVGTNAEVLLGNADWLVACAGAAGPALEGGVSAIGMTAGPGVIDTVVIDPETRNFDTHTIGGEPPRGICGSGMIDLAAQLFLSEMIDIRGRIVPEACGERFRLEDGVRQVIIVPASQSATGFDLTISQVDLDSLIRSKAAMYTILETITSYVGITFADITTFYIAGTFGSFIKPGSAISIGMIPDLPEGTYQVLGNSSLGGATRVLLSRAAMAQTEKIRDRITYLELNVNQDFMNRFSAAKFLPHTDPTRFPSVKARR